MRKFKKLIKIDFEKIDDRDVEEWAKDIGAHIDEIPILKVEVDVEFDAGELTDSELQIEYNKRFRDDLDALSRSYKFLAEGNVTDAMDLMARAFNLADPAHEKKLADLIARGRAKEIADA